MVLRRDGRRVAGARRAKRGQLSSPKVGCRSQGLDPPSHRDPRRDVAGYSRMMGADEEGTHERLRAHLRQLIDRRSRSTGATSSRTRDGLLAEFASVVDAVRCAAEVQRGMIDREPDLPDDRRINFGSASISAT